MPPPTVVASLPVACSRITDASDTGAIVARGGGKPGLEASAEPPFITPASEPASVSTENGSVAPPRPSTALQRRACRSICRPTFLASSSTARTCGCVCPSAFSACSLVTS